MHSERKQRKRRRLNQKSEPILLTLAYRLSKSCYDKYELGLFTFHGKINASEFVLLWQRLCIMTVLPDTKAVKEPQICGGRESTSVPSRKSAPTSVLQLH